MKVFIIDNGSTYINELRKLINFKDVSIIDYGEIILDDIDDNTLVILSGGHSVPILWHEQEYEKEINLIKNHTGPIIGICLGFQILAHVFGSHLFLLDEKRKGTTAITPTNEGLELLDNREYIVFENHHWAARELKKPLIPLAKSDDGIEFFKHQTKPVYATQFHPEGPDNIDGITIFKTILNQLD